jgi:hypothetical protein
MAHNPEIVEMIHAVANKAIEFLPENELSTVSDIVFYTDPKNNADNARSWGYGSLAATLATAYFANKLRQTNKKYAQAVAPEAVVGQTKPSPQTEVSKPDVSVFYPAFNKIKQRISTGMTKVRNISRCSSKEGMLLLVLLVITMLCGNGFYMKPSSGQVLQTQKDAMLGIVVNGSNITPHTYKASSQIPIRITTPNTGTLFVSFNNSGGGQFPFIPKCPVDHPCELTKDRPILLNWNPLWGPNYGGCINGCSYGYTVAPGYGNFVGGNPWGIVVM